jgi:hypothetical protein
MTASVDVTTGATVADNAAISTVVPPSWTKVKGVCVGVLVVFKDKCIGVFADGAGQRSDDNTDVKSAVG